MNHHLLIVHVPEVLLLRLITLMVLIVSVMRMISSQKEMWEYMNIITS